MLSEVEAITPPPASSFPLNTAGSAGYYWSSVPQPDGYAYGLEFNMNFHEVEDAPLCFDRYLGRSLRPVHEIII